MYRTVQYVKTPSLPFTLPGPNHNTCNSKLGSRFTIKLLCRGAPDVSNIHTYNEGGAGEKSFISWLLGGFRLRAKHVFYLFISHRGPIALPAWRCSTLALPCVRSPGGAKEKNDWHAARPDASFGKTEPISFFCAPPFSGLSVNLPSRRGGVEERARLRKALGSWIFVWLPTGQSYVF